MSKDFKTPSGLKIRLVPSFFMIFLTGDYRTYTSEEMTVNPVLTNMVSTIDQRWKIPTMLKWYATLVFFLLFPESGIIPYCLTVASIYLFGVIWRMILPDILLNFVVSLLEVVYSIIDRFFILPYVILVAVGFVTKSYELMLVFVVISALLALVTNVVIDFLIIQHTSRKYGHPFHDTELTAFATFYVLLHRTGGLKTFINEYCSYIETIDKPNSPLLQNLFHNM